MTPPPDPQPLIDMARRVMREPPITGVEVRPYNPHECADWEWQQSEAHGEIRQDGTVEPGHARKVEGEPPCP